MPKGRIGLSLDEDVMGILNRYGRAERPGADATAEQIQAYVADKRPTRTEIIEDAVRLWVGEIGQYAEGDKRPRTNGSTPDRSTIPPDDRKAKLDADMQEFLSKAKDELGEDVADALASRRALGNIASEAFEAMGHKVIDVTPSSKVVGRKPLERKQVKPIPKPGKSK